MRDEDHSLRLRRASRSLPPQRLELAGFHDSRDWVSTLTLKLSSPSLSVSLGGFQRILTESLGSELNYYNKIKQLLSSNFYSLSITFQERDLAVVFPPDSSIFPHEFSNEWKLLKNRALEAPL